MTGAEAMAQNHGDMLCYMCYHKKHPPMFCKPPKRLSIGRCTGSAPGSYVWKKEHTERQGIIVDIYYRYRRDSKTVDETEEILHESVR